MLHNQLSLDALFEKYDEDGSGTLELQEFAHLVMDHFQFADIKQHMSEQERQLRDAEKARALARAAEDKHAAVAGARAEAEAELAALRQKLAEAGKERTSGEA